MPVLLVLQIAIQVGLAVHAVKTGRETFWIYIILIPIVGPAIYIMTQVLPDLGSNRNVRRAGKQLGQAINPLGEVRHARDMLELADNIENRLNLADACVEAKLFDEAEGLYRSCLNGAYEDDPELMLKLAQVRFAQGEPEDCRHILERLITKQPEFRSVDGHLLYARSLQELGEIDRAIHEYESLFEAFPGEEARIRYALLLKEQGEITKSVQLFRQTLLRTKRSPGYYRQTQKYWIKIAKDNLS